MASDLKSVVGSTSLNLGNRNGEEIEIEDGPLSEESGSHKHPGFPIKSTRYSLYGEELEVNQDYVYVLLNLTSNSIYLAVYRKTNTFRF